MNSLLLFLLSFGLLLLLGFLAWNFFLWRLDSHDARAWGTASLTAIRSAGLTTVEALARTSGLGIEYAKPVGGMPRSQGLVSTPVPSCPMFPLPGRPLEPAPIPEIPLGPARSLCRAVNLSCRSGPIAARFLTGHPKAIVVPWFGSLDRDPDVFVAEAGDGVPRYTEPNCDLWQDPPGYVQPSNYRMAVPVWVISTPDYEEFHRGHGEVVLCGHMHPLHNGALVDYFEAGVFQARRYYWDSKLSPMAVMRINLGTRLGELEAAGAWLGPVPLLTPPWQPRQGTAS